MKKFIRTGNPDASAVHPQAGDGSSRHRWKVLLVDDEPDVRQMSRLCLKDFQFAGREIEILEAGSANEARSLLARHPDVAAALIDVVMETDDAGLRLVEHIRKELGNTLIRLIIRTGQPGMAPERYVIDHFDIDDYKDKADLTATRLYTAVRSALKSYRDLRTIDLNRAGLSRLLSAAPEIYSLGTNSLSDFFHGVLTQVVGLCGVTDVSSVQGAVVTLEGAEDTVQAMTGNLCGSPRMAEIQKQCLEVINGGKPDKLRKGVLVLPLTAGNTVVGYVYLEPTADLAESDVSLIHLMVQQFSAAFENVKLHVDLKEAFEHAVDMLAEVSEFKDKTTGDHVARIGEYTRLVAMEMGVPEDEAAMYGAASRLHDVGKLGVSDEILRKPGPLRGEELAAMQAHTAIGATVLSHDKSFSLAREISLGHHERWDGKGYPQGVPSETLHLATRIVSVVDVFDALVSLRPYKKSWDPEKAARVIADEAGAQFDPAVAEAFGALYRRGAFSHLIERSRKEALAAAAGVLKEIADRQRMDAAQWHAQKMESLGNLAGGIAHDINNMLQPVLGLTDLMRSDLAEGSSARQQADWVLESAKRIRDLVTRILAFAREEEMRLEKADIAQVVRDALALLRPALPSTLTITEDIDESVGEVMVNVTQIHSALMNLCSNAADATDGKVGICDISLARKRADEELARRLPELKPGGVYAVLAVADSGKGIPPSNLPRIFDPFFTTKPAGQGTGLGLSIVHGIVSQHGGAIDVSSAEGGGARFEIYLPLA